MRPLPLLFGAFLVSGAAGLSYELVWSRYLALLLGHSAYAQVVVIAVFLGGMGVGAALVGRRSASIARPLVWYAGAEAALALAGLAFHPVFRAVSAFALEHLLPGLPSWASLGLPWALAVAMILPQSILLGATFPLMTAGLLRGFPGRGAGAVADAYLWNSLGGAAGILFAGFVLVPKLGTFGALLAAAAGNLVAAAVALRVVRTSTTPDLPEPLAPCGAHARTSRPPTGPAPPNETFLERVLLLAFGTAVASFLYEIGWIRMLSLLMGSASHAFELMLSAFILGLALGARLIRARVDAAARPLRLLGWVQWAMGLAALASIPMYAMSFGLMETLLQALPRDASGYLAFNAARYGLALAIMLPSTVLAGATLPLMTGILLRHGTGERAVGWVYGANTFGSVVGVIAAGLILMPLLGLKGLLVAGALLDMALGVGILAWSRSSGEAPSGRWTVPSGGAAVVAAAAVLATLLWVDLDRAVLTSGVFRYGVLPDMGSHEMLFSHDGRTSTVGVHLARDSDLLVLTSNGKPDASLTGRWIRAAAGEPVPREPIVFTDEATQTLAAMVLMAHAPEARRAVNIGHGSGMSAEALLTSSSLEELVTIEIEPAMVRGSQLFLPANARVFEDPRHRFVFDDARAYLARSAGTWDLILSEPSNPWVSGVASLFTEEFYRRIRTHLADGGVFGQWLQLYETNDDLLLTVLAALHRVFPDYRAYMVGQADLLLIAGDRVPDPDWRVAVAPELQRSLSHIPVFDADALGALSVFDRRLLAPLIEAGDPPLNSDFRPTLEAGAERARFLLDDATGALALSRHRFDLAAALTDRARPAPEAYATPPVFVIGAMLDRARTRWFRAQRASGDTVSTAPYVEWRDAYQRCALFTSRLERGVLPEDWRTWLLHFVEVEALLHRRTAGWADEPFFADVRAFLDNADPPPWVSAGVDFMHGLARWDWPMAVRGADGLMGEERPPFDPVLFVDGAATAYLKTGRPSDAGRVLDRFGALTRRAEGDLRGRLLRAWVVAPAPP